MARTQQQSAPSAKAPETRTVRVRATRLGFYDLKRRKPGDTFTFKLKKDPKTGEWPKLGSWMEVVNEKEAEGLVVAEIPRTLGNQPLFTDDTAKKSDEDEEEVL